jgi:hypothetical protein
MRAPARTIERIRFHWAFALSSASLAALGCYETPPTPEGGLQLGFEPIEHDLDFSYVTDMEFARTPNDELIVTDLLGGIAHVRLEDGRMTTLSVATEPETYFDLDAGLLGVAVDPDFANNHFVYVGLNTSKTHNILRRYTISDDPEQTLASKVTILETETPGAPRWHNITSLGFEDDEVMWVAYGDKGVFYPAQDPADVRGSLLRIVPSREESVGGYTIPAGATLYSPDADPAVYSKGLRSPWRAIFHEGKWYIGDVGLDSIEEVNRVDGPGQNFGWDLVEGPCALDVLGKAPSDCAERFVDPWIHYDRSNSHPFVADDSNAVPTTKRSVYAGWIYQPMDGDPYKGRWNDLLVFGDTYVGFMRGKSIAEEAVDYHVGHLQWASAWGQGPDGYVYVAAISGEQKEGEPLPTAPIYRAVLAE